MELFCVSRWGKNEGVIQPEALIESRNGRWKEGHKRINKPGLDVRIGGRHEFQELNSCVSGKGGLGLRAKK